MMMTLGPKYAVDWPSLNKNVKPRKKLGDSVRQLNLNSFAKSS